MVEMPFAHGVSNAPGWMRESFVTRIPQNAETVVSRGPSILTRLLPIFSFQQGYSSAQKWQLKADTQAYNAVKDTIETATDRAKHAQVGVMYEDLMWRHANEPRATLTIFGKSFSLGVPEKAGSEIIFEPYVSPFSQRAENIRVTV